ncbi:hypothetical protein OA098_01060 [Prochlorococcus sp. AH-736-B04]|nr:hypothetical protein [Prochlorococcus sp. AH-736-B04]
MNFTKIFKRHYFTNHYKESINLEKVIRNRTSYKECVSFSNSCHLLIAIFDEIVINNNLEVNAKSIEIFGIDNSRNHAIKKFLLNFRNNNLMNIVNRRDFFIHLNKYSETLINNHSSIIIKNNGEILGIILDFDGVTELSSGAILLTNNKLLSDIIRCSRSSYGRDKVIDIHISANGRFSEFQALILANYINQLK